MPSPHPAAALYKPTIEEEAYAIYIFEKLFGSSPVSGNFCLDSKNSLSVLVQKSGVSGLLLRSMWSVADPEGKKCFTDIAQFHVLLRLIALSQDGLLEQEISSAFNQQGGQTTPAAVMKKTLWMSSDYDDCPLPSFEGVAKPSDGFLREFSGKLKGNLTATAAPKPSPASANTPVPAPVPNPAPAPFRAPAPAPTPLTRKPERKTAPLQSSASKEARKKQSDTSDKDIQSAIQQIEGLSVDYNKANLDSLKDLDPDNFELLQEQAALQRALYETSNTPTSKATTNPPKSKSKTNQMSEDEALQRAIYESTHASSPSKPVQGVAVAAAAAAPNKNEHGNWLRMSSFGDSSGEIQPDDDDSDDGGYKKKKAKQGGAAYAAYLASQDPANDIALQSKSTKTGSETTATQETENDKKPAAKPAAVKPVPKQLAQKPVEASAKSLPEKHKADKGEKSNAQTTTSSTDDTRVDEYPQAVQELVMNGFELEKAIQGYKMLGDNFDDIVLFLTSNMTIKELVINGFNIRKVVQAYEFIGDNMDELIAYLMANPPS